MKHKAPKLKTLSIVVVVLLLVLQITSCSSSTNNQPATAEGFQNIEKALKDQFGKDAYYTDLTVTYNKSIGNIVGVTVTENPESLKMGQWNLTQDTWQQNSDITIEVPAGTKASDYMFQLGEAISLSKLGGLVEQCLQKLKEENNLENPTLSIAGLNFPDNGDISKAQYVINLQPENGGTTFSFYYSLSGDLIKSDY
ncbi:hypothetical protein [Winogradskyella sp. SYSU M77433]|uniref:hypothetical protein n=1 Tax=Winogradskyella sp. SYSU M77433 TaxID=3042722 RepID=UPI00247FED1E|nr:hypothetical protein [Winogradskyella sp. SYSU M77433]MDH7913069.1 hypothetical protein [Winogradskyella sp. SYSU M77433]